MRISSPCHENYNSMTSSSDGRFCASCQKVVIDFTQMNAHEISRHLKSNSSKEICGRFKSPQLGEGSRLEKFIWRIKERAQLHISFVPARVVFVGILTGLSTFMSSCMGKVVENYPNEGTSAGNKQTEKTNSEQKPDTLKGTPK